MSSGWSNLPEEISEEIFLKLPAKSILLSRCVCKLFYTLLSKPSFIKNHVNQTKNKNPKLLRKRKQGLTIYSRGIKLLPAASSSRVPYEFEKSVQINYPFESKNAYSVDFLGTCNGLICLKIKTCNTIKSGKVYSYHYSILNPLTREYKEFWRPDKSCRDVAYGFGYDGKIDDYKLVILSGYGCLKIDIYTLRSDSWRSIQCAVNYKFPMGKETRGVFFNGAIHWSRFEGIVCFDISNETMVEMQFPENSMLPKGAWWGISADVGVWGDCICLAIIWGSYTTEVWVMQQYGVRESWIKEYTTTIRPPSSPLKPKPCWKPLWCFENGEILVNYFSEELHFYDPAMKRVTSKLVCDITMDDNRESYVESIVSLNSGKYMKKQITDGKG